MNNVSIGKITGIVIKEVKLKEADKIITIFSKEMGKVQLYATRAQNIKSPFLAGTQLFTYASFIYSSKNSINFLNQISIINGFEKIKFDIEKIYYAMYFLEFLDKSVELEYPGKMMFEFIVNTLYTLDGAKEDVKLIRAIYELKMISLLGYTPEVTSCVKCDKEIEGDNYHFSFEDCGLLCEKCIEPIDKAIKLNKTTVYGMQYIIYIELNKIFLFTLTPEILKELRLVIDGLIKININQSFRTLDFLNEI